MIQLYKGKFNLSHILESPLKSVSAPPAYFTRNFSSYNFQPIYYRTSTLLNSFYPSSIQLLELTPKTCRIKFLSVSVQIATESNNSIILSVLTSSHY